jgi:pilus assembly protein CpaF
MSTPIPHIQSLLDDPAVDRILIDGWQHVYIEKQNQFVDVPSLFQNEGELYTLIHVLADARGVQVDEQHPLASLRLPDGTRVDVALPPVSLVGPAVALMKVRPQPIQYEDLIRSGTLTQAATDFLRACVEARLNIAISGRTASGKSTLLKILGCWIPLDERVLFLQEEGQPGLPHPRLVTLETRPADRQGMGAVTLRDLVQSALRMRPDRIIVEELLGGEVSELVYAMNCGHDGCLFSLHSNGPRDTLGRLEYLFGRGEPEIPLIAMREQISSAVDLIIHLERLTDGSRKIVHISEVTGMDSGVIALSDIFLFELTGYADGAVQGTLRATGIIPKFLELLNTFGIQLPVSMFTPSG